MEPLEEDVETDEAQRRGRDVPRTTQLLSSRTSPFHQAHAIYSVML